MREAEERKRVAEQDAQLAQRLTSEFAVSAEQDRREVERQDEEMARKLQERYRRRHERWQEKQKERELVREKRRLQNRLAKLTPADENNVEGESSSTPHQSTTSSHNRTLPTEDVGDFTDFYKLASDEDETLRERDRERQDAELACLLQEQEVKRRGGRRPSDDVTALDSQLAGIIQELEEVKLRRRQKSRASTLVQHASVQAPPDDGIPQSSTENVQIHNSQENRVPDNPPAYTPNQSETLTKVAVDHTPPKDFVQTTSLQNHRNGQNHPAVSLRVKPQTTTTPSEQNRRQSQPVMPSRPPVYPHRPVHQSQTTLANPNSAQQRLQPQHKRSEFSSAQAVSSVAATNYQQHRMSQPPALFDWSLGNTEVDPPPAQEDTQVAQESDDSPVSPSPLVRRAPQYHFLSGSPLINPKYQGSPVTRLDQKIQSGEADCLVDVNQLRRQRRNNPGGVAVLMPAPLVGYPRQRRDSLIEAVQGSGAAAAQLADRRPPRQGPVMARPVSYPAARPPMPAEDVPPPLPTSNPPNPDSPESPCPPMWKSLMPGGRAVRTSMQNVQRQPSQTGSEQLYMEPGNCRPPPRVVAGSQEGYRASVRQPGPYAVENSTLFRPAVPMSTPETLTTPLGPTFNIAAAIDPTFMRSPSGDFPHSSSGPQQRNGTGPRMVPCGTPPATTDSGFTHAYRYRERTPPNPPAPIPGRGRSGRKMGGAPDGQGKKNNNCKVQ